MGWFRWWRESGGRHELFALVRIDPPKALYYANGGILQYVLRQLLETRAEPVGV